MNFKEVKVEVDRLLMAGHSKYDVFNRMSGHGITNDKLALIIALYADPSRIAANKIWINILLTLIFIQTVISFFVGLGQGVNSHSDVVWLWGVGAVIIPLGCFFNIYKNHALGYSIYLSSLMLSLKGLIDIAKTEPSAALIGAGMIVCVSGYTWLVKLKIFPDLVLFKAKKVNGFYAFTDWQTNNGPFSEANSSIIVPNEYSRLRKGSIIIILFLIIYILSLTFDFFNFNTQPDRHLIFDVKTVLHCVAIICMISYIFYYRPRPYIVLFKAIPILLVIVDIAWWSRYSNLFEGASEKGSITAIVVFLVGFCITTLPAWYLCFRFAYLKDIKQ